MSTSVRAICNWTDSGSFNRRIVDQSLYSSSDGITFVDDDSYEWLVVFNTKQDFPIQVPRERVIGFIQEPPDHGFYFDRNIGEYCSVVYTCAEAEKYNIEGNLISFPCGMFYHMEGQLKEYLRDSLTSHKCKSVSMVTSGLSHGDYAHRVRLAEELASSGLVDVYGRGLHVPGSKGELSNKRDGLLAYRYSVCMENGIWDTYISDKIIDAILCRAVPIYVGARDVLKYIPFALTLTAYQDPQAAAREIQELVRSTDYEALVPQMNTWTDTYAREYTIYSRIKQHILGY